MSILVPVLPILLNETPLFDSFIDVPVILTSQCDLEWRITERVEKVTWSYGRSEYNIYICIYIFYYNTSNISMCKYKWEFDFR